MRFLWTVVLVLIWTGAARAEEVVLRLGGIQADQDADAISQALAKVESVKIAIKPTREKPEVRIAFDLAKADVGDLARAVAGAPTPSRDKSTPAATLVLAYERLDGSAAADEIYLPGKVERAVAALKGVDTKKCSIDFKKKQLLLKLDDKGDAKLADIKKSFGGLVLKTP
jgi:hypothetical protein